MEIYFRNNYFIPLSIFSNRNLSILESLVKFLKERHSLTFADISILLNRDQRTIWTVYHRVKIKDKLTAIENNAADEDAAADENENTELDDNLNKIIMVH